MPTDHPVRAGEVQFGLLSSEETRKMSTVQIKDTTIYYRGLPNPYGINDHRMGTVDRRLLCDACGRGVKECQGHTGHIELSFPMYHIGFFDMCFKTLRCVCFTCSSLLLSDDERNNLGADDGKTRFLGLYNTLKGRKKCQRCGMMQPSYAPVPVDPMRLASRHGMGVGGGARLLHGALHPARRLVDPVPHYGGRRRDARLQPVLSTKGSRHDDGARTATRGAPGHHGVGGLALARPRRSDAQAPGHQQAFDRAAGRDGRGGVAERRHHARTAGAHLPPPIRGLPRT